MASTIPDPHPGPHTPGTQKPGTHNPGPHAPDPRTPGTHTADETARPSSKSPANSPSERASRIETHGIDLIADGERRGRPRQLFAIWAAANVNYLSLVTGGALILMGLSLWQALAVIVVGNLFWLATGLLAVSGPAAGAPSEVITRAMYGVRGNRVNNAIVGWLISVCYFALNLAAASTAAFSLVEMTGIAANTGVQVAVVVVIAALTLAIGVYGHGMITKLYLPIALVLTAVFAVVAVPVLAHTDFGHTPAEPLSGIGLWSALIAGATLIASAPLSYTTSADFSRYLPRTTSAKAVAGWTALGGFLPGVIVCSLGACAATAVDMSNPQTGLAELLPAWFTPVFLLALVLGTIAINALTSYSAGLALQAVGIRIRRARSVIVDGAAAVSLTLYGLLISNFLDTVSNVLQLTVVLLGPAMAVYATDILLRRNRYDGPALMDETPGSPFWYTAGVKPAGALALTAGVTAAALCVNTLYTGPVAQALGGVDLALPVGVGVASTVYAVLMRVLGRGPRPGHRTKNA